MGSEKALLSAADYILFTLMLLVSAGIGLYFRFSGGKQKTMNEYLLAGKNMPILPVAFSIMASYLSAVSVIGAPAEVYMFGIHLFYSNFAHPIGLVLASYVCLPVFFKLGTCTAYEILYTSIVLYAPALALSAATSLSIWTSVLSVGVVCTFYCTLGGMKAVLWTDLFQALLMFIGICAVLIKGFLDLGFTEVFKIGYEGGRIAVPEFSLNLTERYTAWNVLSKGIIMPLTIFGANQVQIQRLLTLRNISRCRKALYIGTSLNIFFHALTYVVGLVIYAHFYKCDPLTAPNKFISSADQLLPYHMMNVLADFPGLAGLCICGIFGAALSTVSSSVNSLSAVTLQDLIKPFLMSRRYSESTMAFAAKALTLLYGVLCILMAVMSAHFGNLVQASMIVWGMCGVPLLSVFLLGMFTTRTNEKGALIGLISSLCMTAWVSFGAAANKRRPKILPISKENCSADFSFSNGTSLSGFSTTTISWLPETSTISASAVSNINAETPYVFPLYRISYLWYGPLGLVVGLIFGYISSIIISHITGEYPDVAEEFVSPVFCQLFGKKKDFKDKETEVRGNEAESFNTGVSIHNSTV